MASRPPPRARRPSALRAHSLAGRLTRLAAGAQLLHRMATNPRKHPLQFGREAVARLLGNPRLVDWKTCLPCPAPGERASTQELEGRMADDFKQAFG